MTDLSSFPITRKWPAQHPDRIQLYSLPTPNGVKASAVLEETGLPMFGQVGFFHKFAGKDYEDKRPRDRYVAEAKRLLGVLDKRLAGRKWVMGEDYTIADMAIFPRVLDVFLARPAIVRALNIPERSK